MNIDIGTLILVLVIVNILQSLAFLLHHLTRGKTMGSFSWLLWSALSAIGYAAIFIRLFLPEKWFFIAALVTNFCLFTACFHLYAGIRKFLGGTFHPALSLLAWFFFLAGTGLSVFWLHDDNLRSVVLCLATAFVDCLAAISLTRNRNKATAISAGILAILLYGQSAWLVSRAIVGLVFFPIRSVLDPSTVQIFLFVIPIVTGYLQSFCLLILLNQRFSAELSETANNLTLIFNTHPDAVWITRIADGVIVEVNHGFGLLFGWGRLDAIGRRSDEIGIWQDPEDRIKVIAGVNNVGIVDNFETMMKGAFGATFCVICSAKAFYMHGMKHCITVAHDITERKKVETLLRKSEEKFRLLIENIYDIVYTVDCSGLFQFASSVWTRYLGFVPDEIIGKSFTDFVHPDDIPVCREFLEKVIATGQPQSGLEYRVVDKEGRWHWHTTSAVPLRDDSGSIQGFYGIARDIDENKRLLGELERQATTDELTGVMNRRHFMRLAGIEFKRALRQNRPLSLALVDIDHFKEINDSRGHAAGDRALVFFADLFARNIRDIDVLSRFGGDEFILLFPGTTADRAAEIIDRCRLSLATTPCEVDDACITIEVSVGIAFARLDVSPPDTLDALLLRADRALYQSKANGRNVVTMQQ
jgi:diguanylate cyclase (GGDEF)-like protein/PAS domain S-box-containing protein